MTFNPDMLEAVQTSALLAAPVQRRRTLRVSTIVRRMTFIDEANAGGIKLMTSSAPRPCIAITGGDLSSVAKIGMLRRPGFYIGKLALKSDDGMVLGYVGQSANDVVHRVRTSERFRHPTSLVALAAITSRDNSLGPQDVAALERIAHRSIEAFGDIMLVNETPTGRSVGLDRYRCLRAFWNEVAICLEENGFLFAGPGELAHVLRCDELIPASIPILSVGRLLKHEAMGVRALIRTHREGYIVLADSEIRSDVVRSVSEAPSVLREELLYAGILVPTARPDILILKQDLLIATRTATSIFVLGSRGAKPDTWCEIDEQTYKKNSPKFPSK